MATLITKNSSTASSVPTNAQLVQGELAVNVTDKRLYTENASGTVVELGTNPGSAVTHTAGTAGAPAITTTGDTNTGIFFPAADTVAASVGGTEGLRLTSTGLGVGTSSPADKLQVLGTIRFGANATYYGTITHDASSTGANIYNHVDSGGHLFQVGGTTLMNLTASGNLGLGVSPSAWPGQAANYDTFQFGTGAVYNVADGATEIAYNQYIDSAGTRRYITTNTSHRYRIGNTEHSWHVAASGTAGNTISFTQAMTLTAGGDLGVGTTSPESILHVAKASSGGLGAQVILDNTATSALNNAVEISFLTDVGASGSGTRNARIRAVNESAANGNANLQFWTWNGATDAERCRITSGGDLLVGGTSGDPNPGVFIYKSGAVSQGNSAGASGFEFLSFRRSGTQIGTVTQNGTTAVAYNTSSDYRLKHDIAPMTGALAKVALLKPCTYKWNADDSAGEGFIAHELAEVCPQAVTGEKDAVDADGNPKYQGIDTSFLVATLTAAIQEQQAMIQQLQAEVAALKGT